jgi:Domain of unknown function (DUF1992)
MTAQPAHECSARHRPTPSRRSGACYAVGDSLEVTMTERKPPGMPWESFIEQQIREAQEAGEFDNLPTAGKPLPDLGTEYDPDWWTKKLLQREQLSWLPPALALLRKVEHALEQLATLRDEAQVRARVQALNVEIRKVNATAAEGPPTRLAPLDEETIVQRWRDRAAPRG